jgi:hypothetical protein
LELVSSNVDEAMVGIARTVHDVNALNLGEDRGVGANQMNRGNQDDEWDEGGEKQTKSSFVATLYSLVRTVQV